MLLCKLFPKTKYKDCEALNFRADINISDIVTDSRIATKECVFVCIKGSKSDGHAFAANAYSSGCRVFVCENSLELPNDAISIKVADSRIALADIAARFYGFPAKKLKLIGITGTKGKSTTAEYIRKILEDSGFSVGIIGTMGISYGDVRKKSENTTPDALVLQKTFFDMLKCGIKYVVMEVSSQAYLMKRVYGLTFDISCFTNLSEDHIGPDEHPNFENYLLCKTMLFENSRISVINRDSEYTDRIAPHSKGQIIPYGIKGENLSSVLTTDETAVISENIRNVITDGHPGVSFDCQGKSFLIKMPGKFTVYNATAAIAVALQLGIDVEKISDSLSDAYVKGRFETVYAANGRIFIIDYAHNAISLKTALELLKTYKPKRLCVLFGSVGGRTKLRRREMGCVAAHLADFCILTSDNPDKEDPLAIISDIEKEMGNCSYRVIPDREEAIRFAVKNSKNGDIILFAGKGHEDYQLTDGKKVPFSERRCIEEALSEKFAEINI